MGLYFRYKKKRPTKLDLVGGDKQGDGDMDETGVQLNLYSRPLEKTALEICGEQMEKSGLLTDEQRESFIRNEQGIIRSHVLHYITQMANMMIPLDINTKIAKQHVSGLLNKEMNSGVNWRVCF